MRNLLFTITALLLYTSPTQAQQVLKYHIYVIATNGKVLNKTYQDTKEISSDKAIQDLHIGYLKGKEFVFTPEESKHKAFFAETIKEDDSKNDVLFQAWDEQAARQIQNAMNKESGQITQHEQHNKEKLTASTVKQTRKKSFEEELLQQLIKDSIIKEGDQKLSIVLTKSALTVNGKKQPEKIFTKYKTFAETLRGESMSEQYRFEYTSEVSN